ncbi:discoidin, CUB and LCCL domain-containing protein 1 [Astyanax mexicanus]|uniref:discoidin, CUB and LCCL domain-containing protein 1 n=1 Tax=Astyanax mexicanus TaxID=7994 RepID=UPI0020CB1ED3|nr:discoidin, CUB and LCCL domain-containing protein 1 [Astyanax mexicanus]
MSSNGVFYGLVFVCSTVFYQLVLTEKPDDGCGESTLGPDSGHLSFKKYPGVYPNNSWCQWKILVSSSLRIVLKFEDLSIDGWDCKTDNLKIHGTKHVVYWQYCGRQKANPTLYLGVNQSLYIDSSEVTVSFRSSIHSSGRGFQLSYSTVDHREMVTCSDKGSSFSHSKYRKYCPAGCGAAQGDVVGDVSQGYSHTSNLCKAAVHAGVILNQFGGPITVENHSGPIHYEAVQANGILSQSDSLSDSFLTFVTNDCNRQTILQPLSTSLSWEKNSLEGTPVDRSPKDTKTVTPTGMWSADCKQWLQLDLGEKKRITGILTKGSTTSDYFVKSYKILYKEKSRWRNYTHYNSSEDTIFEGNVDNLNQTRYTFHPAITARYLCVVPLQWHRGTGLTVELLGCDVRTTPVSSSSQVTLEAFPGEETDITEPVPSQSELVQLAIILVPTILAVALLLLAICLCRALHKKKTKENTYDSADPPHAGCWKQVKHPSARQQSTEFTFSYSSEKDHLPKIDLVTSDMADYQQPLMLGVGTVSRKGSTFRPMDTDTKDEVNETATHYDYLHTANQYALPLTNQEPEYATPIIERHAFRKDGFLPDPSYSVPGVVLSKSPSFKTKDSSNYRKVVGGISGGYQTPQVKLDRANHSEGVYDSPKVRKPLGVQNGVCSEYQRPQKKTTAQESYSTPRDCVRLDTTAPCRPDPEGSSLSGP